MQEKRKLKTKAIPAVDARPTKEGKQASTTLMSKRLPPAAGWALAGGLPKGPIVVEGKRGGESLFGWSLAWEFPVPLSAGSANCRGWSLMFPLVPTPPTSISQGESVPFRPPKVHTHTHTHSPVQAHTGQTLRQEATTQQDLSAGFSPRARRCGRPCGTSICGVHLHTWACDGRRTQQSQPASQTHSDEHGNGLGEVGRWEREEGSMKQALYLSCPRNLLRAEPSLASRPRLSSSPSLHLSPSVSLHLSPPLMVSCPCHPLPSSPAGSVVERKQSERGTRGHQPALGRPRCVTGR